jgi:hypothetical protein
MDNPRTITFQSISTGFSDCCKRAIVRVCELGQPDIYVCPSCQAVQAIDPRERPRDRPTDA